MFSGHVDNFGVNVIDADGSHLSFPSALNLRSTTPHFVLLGSPFGDTAFCAAHVQKLRGANKKLLDSLCQLFDPQVALHLLRTCASFCKFVYVARTTPPRLVCDALKLCDVDVRACFEGLAVLQLSDVAWCQSQLSLSGGGLGLRSTARHCTAAYISSHTFAMPGVLTSFLHDAFALHAVAIDQAAPDDHVCAGWLIEPPAQRALSLKIEHVDALALKVQLSPADRIRFNSVCAPRSSAWLQAMPSVGPFDMTLSPDEVQVALQHRLGLSLAQSSDRCSLCSKNTPLDSLGHHHLTCPNGGYVAVRHNRLRDALYFVCRAAGLNSQREKGASHDDASRPADLLVSDWCLGQSAAFDITVVSPLSPDNLLVAGDEQDVVAKAAALKHDKYDAKCADLGWQCVPLAVDSYGRWGDEAHKSFTQLASHLKTRTKVGLCAALNSVYNPLGVVLARQNARAILARRVHQFPVGTREVHQLALVASESL